MPQVRAGHAGLPLPPGRRHRVPNTVHVWASLPCGCPAAQTRPSLRQRGIRVPPTTPRGPQSTRTRPETTSVLGPPQQSRRPSQLAWPLPPPAGLSSGSVTAQEAGAGRSDRENGGRGKRGRSSASQAAQLTAGQPGPLQGPRLASSDRRPPAGPPSVPLRQLCALAGGLRH